MTLAVVLVDDVVLARRWGEWLALLSATLYVPFEIYAIARGVSWLKVTLLLLNVAFVAYLTVVLIATRRKRAMAAARAGRASVEQDTGVT